MSNINKKDLLKERSKLLNELASLSLLLQGSCFERFSTCSRPACKCHQGKRHGPRRYIVVNENGRQRQKYIPNSMFENAQVGIKQFKRSQEIINCLTQINLKFIKEGLYGDH